MKRITTIVITLLALLVAYPPLYAQQSGLKSGKEYPFIETRVMPKMKKTTERKGIMVFEAPETLRMDYSQPAGEYTHISAGKFDVCKGGKVQHLPVKDPKHPMSIYRATLLYCLGGEVEKAAKMNHASIDYSTSGKTKICTLSVEKAAPRDIAKLQLTYILPSGQLKSMTITEGNGNYTTYTIQ
ncbi:MAG: outer membrane lipoprotein carrier protein LolA [Paludibacteraceae bacterium]|nr:outer membrane lipoprotein carrier protein LolA [Paludibacteraceae bacterium]